MKRFFLLLLLTYLFQTPTEAQVAISYNGRLGNLIKI